MGGQNINHHGKAFAVREVGVGYVYHTSSFEDAEAFIENMSEICTPGTVYTIDEL